ncbi:PspC domain-containing protein [Puniceicoccaceae bacterium K14]|nr:PspC domain-containing protein [Puniceicoccaceae bacterium K14]
MKRKFYRSRNGIIFGLCRGISEYFDISLFWIRAFTIGGLIFTGFFPIGLIYIIMGLVIKAEPLPSPVEAPKESNHFESYTSSRKLGLWQLKEKFSSLETRIRRMEDHVTDRAYDWERRFNADKG